MKCGYTQLEMHFYQNLESVCQVNQMGWPSGMRFQRKFAPCMFLRQRYQRWHEVLLCHKWIVDSSNTPWKEFWKMNHVKQTGAVLQTTLWRVLHQIHHKIGHMPNSFHTNIRFLLNLLQNLLAMVFSNIKQQAIRRKIPPIEDPEVLLQKFIHHNRLK